VAKAVRLADDLEPPLSIEGDVGVCAGFEIAGNAFLIRREVPISTSIEPRP
jgi:hypothetical protein